MPLREHVKLAFLLVILATSGLSVVADSYNAEPKFEVTDLPNMGVNNSVKETPEMENIPSSHPIEDGVDLIENRRPPADQFVSEQEISQLAEEIEPEFLETGQIEVTSSGQGEPLNSFVEVLSIDEFGQPMDIVASGTIEQTSFIAELSPGRYMARVHETSTIDSDIITIRLGETVSFDAEFVKLDISGYDLTREVLSTDFAVYDTENHLLKELQIRDQEDISLWVTPGTYEIESNDITHQIDVSSFETLPLLIPGPSTDNVAFGQLAIYANTTEDMPVSASYQVYNTTDDTLVTSSSTGNDGFVSLNLAPYTYRVQVYVHDDFNPLINSSVTVLSEQTTSVYNTFTQVLVYPTGDNWVYVYDNVGNNVENQRRYSNPATVFYLTAGMNYSVQIPSEATNYYNVEGGMGEKLILGSINNIAPTFVSNPTINQRVNANETGTLTIRVTDLNFDYPLNLFFTSNMGTFTQIDSYWESQNIYRYHVNFTAPIIDDTYRVDLGIADDGGLFNNFTIFVSDRSTTVAVNSTGYQDRPLDQWIYAINVNNGASSAVRTYADGYGEMTLFDGEYFLRWTSTINHETQDYFINQTSGPYSFAYSWAEVTINSTAEYGFGKYTNIRIYDSSDLVTQLASSTTDTNTGLRTLVIPSEIQYSFKVYATTEASSIWATEVDLLAGDRPTLDFQFGLLAVYLFDTNSDPQDIWTYLYNATSSLSTSINAQRTYGDGIALYTLAPYNNYSISFTRNSNVEWYSDIVITANTAQAIVNFTNSAPTISSFTASPRRIAPDQNTTLTVIANDIDPIDSLDYTWTITEGTIIGSGNEVVYVAPSTVGIYQIDVNVTDQFGGWVNSTIWVSSRTTSITFNVTRGGGTPLDNWVYIQDGITLASAGTGRTYADGLVTIGSIYDGLYRIYVQQATLMEKWVFFTGGTENIDFRFADIVANTTTANDLGFNTATYLVRDSDQVQVSSGTTNTQGLYTYIVNPDTYDLRATSSGTHVRHNDVAVSANEVVTLNFSFARIHVNITTGYGQQVDLWTYLYNGSNSLVTSIDASRTYSDGFTWYDVAPGNFSIWSSFVPGYWNYNIEATAGNLYSAVVQLGVLVVYTNDGSNPQNLNIKFYYGNTTNLIQSTSPGTDGILVKSLAPGTYDVLIDDSVLYEDVLVTAEGRVEVGTRLNHLPSIDAVSYTRVVQDETSTVTLDVTDLDYDYPTLDLSVITNVGTVSNLKAFHGFIQTGEFRITFDYNAPSTLGTFMLNVTVSDGFGGEDTVVIFLSNQNNVVHLHSYRDDNTPEATSVYLYDVEFGTQVSSINTGTDGYAQLSIPDGIYNVRFVEDNDIWFYNVAIIGNQIYNYTATFGVVEIYVTTTGGVPVDAWTYAFDHPRTTSSFSAERTYADGIAIYILAPGTYEFDIVQTNTITIVQTVEGGQKSIVGTDIPQLDNPPADITYEYGQTGYSISWNFTESDPDYYNITRDGVTIDHGVWDGSVITISVDGLFPGVYEFRVYVNDTNGLPNQDTVFVTVTAGPAPLVNPHGDMTGEFGSDVDISFVVNGDNADQYVVYLDEAIFATGVWTPGFVNITLSGYSIGTYNLTIFINDTLGQNSIDQFTLTISDTTSPAVNSPADVGYYQGETGYDISWNISDLDPDRYVIYLDGVEMVNQTWTSPNTVVYSVDGLAVGVYAVVIEVYDSSGNMATDTVTVTVSDPSIQLNSSPANASMEADGTLLLEWDVSGYLLLNYSLYINDIFIETGSPVGGISFGFQTSDLGAYNFTVVIHSQFDMITDYVVITVVDTTAPAINSPIDISYEIGTTGNTVEWTASDLLQATYSLYIDGVLIESDAWTNNQLSFNVDGLALGSHNVTLAVEDTSGNISFDSVTVTVNAPPADSTLELSSKPVSQLLGLSIANVTLDWTIVTNNPGTYSLELDGVEVDSGSTSDGQIISYLLSFTTVGNYELTLTLVNGDGITLVDSVYITVIDDSGNISTTEDTPFGSLGLLALALLGMGVLVRRKEEVL